MKNSGWECTSNFQTIAFWSPVVSTCTVTTFCNVKKLHIFPNPCIAVFRMFVMTYIPAHWACFTVRHLPMGICNLHVHELCCL